MDLPNIYFFILAVIAGTCGFGILASRHPITAAVNLVGVMIALAGIYGLLAGPFLGIVQILVYAGAIMMLVIFVIMVLNSAKERKPTPSGRMAIPALLIPLAVVGLIGAVLQGDKLAESTGIKDPTTDKVFTTVATEEQLADMLPDTTGTIDRIAIELFSSGDDAWYVLFEVIGLVLLVAMVGAVLLAKRSISTVPKAEAVEEGHH